MKKLLALLLALCMVFALCACGAKDDGASNKLVLYCTMTENDIDALLTAFGEKYPDIEVEVVNGSAG